MVNAKSVLGILSMSLLLTVLMGCSNTQMKAFAKDVGHNYGCSQQFENLPNQAAMQDNCINQR